MKPSLLSKLRCPISGGPLQLIAFETEVAADGVTTLTKEGVLLSEEANVWYPISRYVPVLLVFTTNFHARFADEHAESLAPFSGFHLPDGNAERGEAFVQRTFTDEWNLTQESELSFLRTDDDLVNLNRNVWLRGLPEGIESLLDVGCGIGKETMALRIATGAKELFAVDLNFALLHAAARYRHMMDVHFVICSLFRLPFADGSFEAVYSQGVIHHTWSTHAAFRSIAAKVRPGGWLFVWVYGLDDHLVFRNEAFRSKGAFLKHLISIAMWRFEFLVRPWLSRAPSASRDAVILMLGFLLHPVFRSRALRKQLWRIENTRHSLRDWLTPPFAHRHHMNEVVEWFEEVGFEVVRVQSPSAHKEHFSGKRIHGIGMLGRRTAPAASPRIDDASRT